MVWKKLLGLFKQKHLKKATKSISPVVDEAPLFKNDNKGRLIQLVIGLDFGTSFTKVVVGEARVHYAIPFNQHSVSENPYLLPSALSILPENQECLLGAESQSGELFDNLKMPLIERDFSIEVQSRAAAYLALVLRYTRNWLLETHDQVYRDRTIQWFINVGLPTDSYDDEALKSTYYEIVKSAWQVSASPGVVTLSAIHKCLINDGKDANRLKVEGDKYLLPSDRISAFPEFSAQLAGYVRSPRCQENLHTMVDIGGGTMDVTIFNVVERDGGHVFPIFERRVVPLGARYLLNHRMKAIMNESVQEYSPFDDLPTNAEFRLKYQISEEQLSQIDLTFSQQVQRTVAESLNYTKKYRYPKAPYWDRISDRYGEGVPSFFCGGSVQSEFYSTVLARFNGKSPPYKLRSIVLPVPDDLNAPSMAPVAYSRLAVAYGLSFDPFDIGHVIKKSEMEDIREESYSTDNQNPFIGKDQV